MKSYCNIITLIIFLFWNCCYSQSDYSIGISLGGGLNIYKNILSADKIHFKQSQPLSLNLGVRLTKNLDEQNKLYTEMLFTRKKIEFNYQLNEPEIPFSNKEKFGQKYDCISLFVGYRRLFLLNERFIYIEGSVGADYNNNVMSYNEGNGESQEGLNDIVNFENFYNTNLGEKSYTISANIGFGFNFGFRNQYDIGFSMNFPIQKIQSKESNYQYMWNYKNKNYYHELKYFGSIYYPSVKLTYYIF